MGNVETQGALKTLNRFTIFSQVEPCKADVIDGDGLTASISLLMKYARRFGGVADCPGVIA
jgi:hypothetical protein